MGKVPTMIKIHSKNGISCLKKSKKYGQIRWRTRMWLNINILCSEEFFCAFNSKIFYLIYELLPCIIPFPRIPFRIFIRKNWTICLENCLRNIILTRDKLQLKFLSILLSYEVTIRLWIVILYIWHRKIRLRNRRIFLVFSFFKKTIWIIFIEHSLLFIKDSIRLFF